MSWAAMFMKRYYPYPVRCVFVRIDTNMEKYCSCVLLEIILIDRHTKLVNDTVLVTESLYLITCYF